jgi:raffinose/stachyose/melibiose transport system permease protein
MRQGKSNGPECLKTFAAFALPGICIFLAVVITPFLYGLYLTFTDWDGVKASKKIIGFANYGSVFQDSKFWTALLLTLKYVVCTVILANLIAFLLAWPLSSGFRGQNFFRAGFFTPNLIGGVVLGFIWQFVFSQALVTAGETTGLPIFSSSWLSDPDKAFWALVIVTVWQLSGYLMLIYIAGFTGLPRDVLEAAEIDGAAGLKRLSGVVIPLLIPSFVICLFFSLSRAFMVYDLNLTLTRGGPFESTVLAAMHVYIKAFTSRQYGPGQAEALILFLMVALISYIQVSIGKKMEMEA